MKKFLSYIALAVICTTLWSGGAFAQGTGNASLTLNPASGVIPAGADWSVRIILNTDGQNSTGADVVLNFEEEKLELKSVVYDKTNSTFYPNDGFVPSISEANASGKLEMARLIAPASPSSQVYTNGTGTFAILTFRPRVTSGTTTLTFDHTVGNTTDSNITPENTSMGLDILKTATNGSYTIGALACTPGTAGCGPTPTPTPQPMPNSGPEIFIWGGILVSSAMAAGLTYRKLNVGANVDTYTAMLNSIQPVEYVAPEDRHNLI